MNIIDGSVNMHIVVLWRDWQDVEWSLKKYRKPIVDQFQHIPDTLMEYEYSIKERPQSKFW